MIYFLLLDSHSVKKPYSFTLIHFADRVLISCQYGRRLLVVFRSDETQKCLSVSFNFRCWAAVSPKINKHEEEWTPTLPSSSWYLYSFLSNRKRYKSFIVKRNKQFYLLSIKTHFYVIHFLKHFLCINIPGVSPTKRKKTKKTQKQTNRQTKQTKLLNSPHLCTLTR